MTDWTTISVSKETRDRLREKCERRHIEYEALIRELLREYQEDESWMDKLGL